MWVTRSRSSPISFSTYRTDAAGITLLSSTKGSLITLSTIQGQPESSISHLICITSRPGILSRLEINKGLGDSVTFILIKKQVQGCQDTGRECYRKHCQHITCLSTRKTFTKSRRNSTTLSTSKTGTITVTWSKCTQSSARRTSRSDISAIIGISKYISSRRCPLPENLLIAVVGTHHMMLLTQSTLNLWRTQMKFSCDRLL